MERMAPDTERERRYEQWYELSLLYHEAIRNRLPSPEIAVTKSLADDAWVAYVDTISDLHGPRRE